MASLMLLKSMLITKALQKSRKKKRLKRRLITHPIIGRNECRVCGEDKAEIPLFNNYLESDTNLAEEIQNFSGVEISATDKFPKNMCQNCLDLLNGCILFRDLCQRTNKAFLETPDIIISSNNYCKEPDTFTPKNRLKKEYEDADVKTEYNLDDNDTHSGPAPLSEDSYNIPSPTFSDNSEIWSCSNCLKDFYNLETYNKHLPKCKVKYIKEEKPQPPEEITKSKFLCETCGKTATSKASLLIHMSTHENIFPYKCDVCPYQGRTIDLLKVHKRSHLADKPFKCTQCPKATTTASNLAKHMRHVHSTTRPFKCTYCEKMFSYQHDMKRHVKDIHLRQGTVECDICYKKFNTKKILQGHRWKIHKIKSERSGRLPSYLLCQMEEQNNMIHCENQY